MDSEFDPIILEIMWNRLVSIAQEQAKTLIHASFTTVVGEMEDLACGIYDAEGSLMAQAVTGTQGILTGMSRGVKEMLKKYPIQSLDPGDILVGNDPWIFTGHKFDIAVITPVFLDDSPVGLVATVLHASDIGGRNSPGDSREVFEEGLEIPIMKLFRKGKRNEDLLEIIESNVRVPEQVLGDLMAQVAANEVGARKLIEFMREHNLSTLLPLSRSINTKTEQALKEAVGSLPDGVYTHEVFMDGINEPLKIAVAITIKGTDITVDFAGTSPQTTVGGINSVYNFTLAYVAHAIKSSLVPDLPNNDGLFRGIRLLAPEGTIVNPLFPAPVMARWMMVSHISSAVFGALAKVAPDRVIADSGTGHMEIVTGVDLKGKRFVYWLVGFGGMGARTTKDGLEATCYPANIGNVPVEIIENVSPVSVVRKEFIPDSGGPGKYRGGCDQAITVKVRSHEPAIINCFLERTAFPALGYWGGMDGQCGAIIVNGTKKINPKQKYILQPGDQLTYSQGGGGGFFPPEERDPDLVLRDVINELVSPEAAREYYKVVIDKERKIIDQQQTKMLRATS